MASNGTIAHRFANRDYNPEKGLKGSSTHISCNNYYSYNTVFGQWVDEKVCIVYNGSTSNSSRKHQLGSWNFPKDVVLLPYDDGGSLSYYGGSRHGCALLGYSKEFTYEHRVELIDYYVHEIYSALLDICGGKKKDLDVFAEGIVNEYWGYVMKLCAMYRDTTISKWLKIKRGKDATWSVKKKMVKELDAQNMDVKSLVDVMFGEGTWKTYYDYCARYRKAADKRAQVEWLCNRLGIGSPYVSYRGYNGMLNHDMTANDIRKLTAKQRNELHFRAIRHKECEDGEKERKEKYNRNRRNAYKWIVGFEPSIDKWNGYVNDSIERCVNMYTGQEYDVSYDNILFGFYYLDLRVNFNYDKFRNSKDKEEWIRNFYAKCEEVMFNKKGVAVLKKVGAHTYPKENRWDDDRYIDDDFLKENTTESEYWYAHRIIEMQEKHLADKAARERASEIARKQREEEERKEKELQAQIKKEQIDACIERGIEGFRDLWRLHYTDIHRAEEEAVDHSTLYHGGNVLLRFSMNKDKIESSKHIRVTIPTCKAMWKMVSKWHENPSSFRQMTIKTLDGTYTISSYRNDILTAGCHDIAYAEMERMYKEIVALENNAV